MAGIPLDTGEEIEEFDGSSIRVRGRNGNVLTFSRRSAPDRFREAVDRAESASAVPLPAQVQPDDGRQVFDADGNVLPFSPQPETSPDPAGRPQTEVQEPAQRAGGFTFIGGGRPQAPARPQFATATQSSTQTTRTRMTPEQTAELRATGQRISDATGRVQESFRGQAVDQALIGQERRDLEGQRAKLLESSEADRQRVATQNREREQRLTDSAEALRADIADDRIDTGRYWRNKSTGSKIMLAIAGFLKGFASKGQDTSVIDQIQGEIDRDINAQKEAFAGKERLLARSDKLYARARQQGLDDLEAVEAAKDAAMGRIQGELQELAARSQSADQQAALMRAADEFAIARDERRQAAVSSLAEKSTTTRTSKRVPVAGTGSIVGGKFPGLKETGERTVPLSKQEVSEVGKANGFFGKAMADLDDMIRIRREHGREFFGEAKNQFDSDQADLISIMGQLQELGVMQPSDVERVKSTLPDVSDIGLTQLISGKDPVLSQLEATRRTIIRSTDGGMRGRFGLTLDRAQGTRRPQGAKSGFAQ